MNSNGQQNSDQQPATDEKIGKPLFAAGLKGIAQQLDACFLPLGFEQTGTAALRKYEGEINGRFLTASFGIRTRNQYITGDISYKKYAGLTMSIELPATLQSRLTLIKTPKRALWLSQFFQKLRKNEPIIDLPTAYEPCTVWANDPDWGRHFLSDSAVLDLLIPIMLPQDLPSTALILSPVNWVFSRPVVPTALSSELVKEWMETLTAVATLAEKNPPPHKVELTWLEKQNQTKQLLPILW